jgi:hypothetical protein
LFFATLPPILEELGWRGYALDRLQLEWSALSASVILGVVWALWHLPLFFIEGSYQHDSVGFATTGFWLFMAGIVALSAVFTWIYNNTERSITGIIVLHGWVNFTAEIIVVPDLLYYGLWFVLAGAIVAIWGDENHDGGRRRPSSTSLVERVDDYTTRAQAGWPETTRAEPVSTASDGTSSGPGSRSIGTVSRIIG